MAFSRPSEPVALSASNLDLLITSDGRNLVEDFVASQTRYAKSRVNEGRAVRASWDISTPEKEKMRLHRDKPSAGFETPVLKPRAAQTHVEPLPRPTLTSPPRPKGSPSPNQDKKAKVKSVFVQVASSSRRNREKDKSTERQKQSSKSSRKRCLPRSDTDEEHLARLADRRERKREKREIMNPREVTKPSTTTRRERKVIATSGPTNKKKQKIPAGFALMHGFSSANVGKNRLTVEPPLNFGVFNKGRASEKVKVDEQKHSKDKGFPSRIFSEDRFLNSRPARQPLDHPSESEHSESMSNKSTSHGCPSSAKRKRSSAALQPRRTIHQQQPSMQSQCDEMSHSVRSKTGANITPVAKRGKSRSSVQSASWAIEKDDCSLPSTSSEVAIFSVKSKTETAVLDVRTTSWGKVLQDNLPDTKRLSPPKPSKGPPTASIPPKVTMTLEVTSKVPPDIDEPATIGPWESASQVARSILTQDLRFTHSKFFPMPQAEKSSFAEHITHLGPPEMSKDFGKEHSDLDANPVMDEPLVRRSASPTWRGEGMLPGSTILSALANASANDAPTFPAERTSVLQTSSLDSVDRALQILDTPEVANLTFCPSRTRRRTIPRQQEFNPTPEDVDPYKYDLEPMNSKYEVPPPLLHPSRSEDIEDMSSPPGNSETLGTVGNTQHRSLDYREEYHPGELETYGENALECYEDYPSTVFNSPVFANDMVYTVTSSPYECQNEAVFFMDEGYEGEANGEIAIETMSESSADFSVEPENNEDARTNIRLWDDPVQPRGEMTNVQRVEQDVAKNLKGHWFPYKF